MVNIYLIRHCEAEGNVAKIFQGTTDCDISDFGAKQLQFLVKRFNDIPLDKVFSSPLIRAYKTALAVVGEKNIPIIKDPILTEMHGGVFEGKPFVQMFESDERLKHIWFNEPQRFAAQEGESMQEVYERAKKAIDKIAKNTDNEGKTVVLSSHGAIIKNMLCYVLYNDIERLIDIPWANNTSVSLITYNNGKYEVEYLNDISHLPNEFTPVEVSKLWEENK